MGDWIIAVFACTLVAMAIHFWWRLARWAFSRMKTLGPRLRTEPHSPPVSTNRYYDAAVRQKEK